MIFILLWISSVFALDDIRNCPSNLVRNEELRAYNGRCYEFVIHHHKDWSHARDDCTSKGGNLAVIRSSSDNNFIMTSLRSLNFIANGAWIGLTDQRIEGKWEWVTGEPVTFTYWGVAQPGLLHNQEDCVVFKYTDSGHWHDYPCTGFLLIQENYPWICEYKQESFQHSGQPSTPTPPTTTAEPTLPDRERPQTTMELTPTPEPTTLPPSTTIVV